MKEQLYINIPAPCHEDWNQMTPVEQGRHCAVCKKNVVDFTNETDDSIIDFFQNYNGNACGRFTDDQLNRPLSKIELKPASDFLKYAAGLLLPGLMLSKANAQKKNTINLKEIIVTGYGRTVGKVVKVNPVAGPIRIDAKDTFTIKPLKPASPEQALSGKVGGVHSAFLYIYEGVVTDERDGSPIPAATIKIKGENNRTLTDIEGKYFFSSSSISVHLVVSSVGYESKTISLQHNKKEAKISLLPYTKGRLSEVIVVGTTAKKKKNIKDSVFSWFSSNKISIYPSPVSVGGTLQLNFGNTKPGFYQIRLLNSSGQLFYSFQKQISSPKETEQIHLNERMSAGMYLLQIIDDKKKLVQTSKVIVQ